MKLGIFPVEIKQQTKDDEKNMTPDPLRNSVENFDSSNCQAACYFGQLID